MKDGDIDAPLELIEAVELWRIWFIRACISAVIIVALAIIIKYALIDPNSVSVIEFEIKADQILKGDREDLKI